MKTKFAAIVLLLVSAPLALARVVLFVDGMHGSDNNNCQSKQTACKTIGHAISLAGPGYVIKVAPATYDENLTINFDLGILGENASTTIIDGQQMNAVINIFNSNTHVVLAGLTVRNGYELLGCGGGIYSSGFVEISDAAITGNVDADQVEGPAGGGICSLGTMVVSHSIVSDNEVEGYFAGGIGIANYGMMTINDSTIAGNFGLATDASAGGIGNDGILVVNRTTISGNSSGGGIVNNGGGIFNSSTATINNSTISGNISPNNGVGGGIDNEFGGTITISNSTIADNSAAGGNAIYNDSSSTVILQNTILSGTVGGNCSGLVNSQGYNLSNDSSCNLNGPGDLNNTLVELGPLQNNGGPTQTMAEYLGDPTIDAGNPNGCTDGNGNLLTTDQRGAPRPGQFKHEKRCDMGAFERQND